MNEDDATLVMAVAQGSDRAFNTLIDRHQQAVRNFLQALSTGMDEADDIAQETFLAVWKSARRFDGRGSVKAWIFAIAWRKAKDAQRLGFRRWKRDTAFHGMEADDPSPPTTAADDLVILDQALTSLPLDQRACVMLCIGCGFTAAEAAQALGLSLGTVKSHVLRGRARLVEAYGVEP